MTGAMVTLRAVGLVLAVGGLLAAATALTHDINARDTATDDQEVEEGPAHVLLVVDGSDVHAAATAEHARVALRRTRVPFAEHDVATEASLPDLAPFRAVLTAVERFAHLDDREAERLAAFVHDGGGLGVLYRGWDPRLADLLGVESSGRPAYVFGPRETLLTTPIMPGGGDLAVGAFDASPLDLSVAADCTVLMTWGEGRPAAWTCARGGGRVAFWNSTLLGTKPFRGHLLQTLALIHPAHVRPLAAWGVVYLDDFPSPASNGPIEPVWSRLGQTPAEFYSRTWYPDMVALGDAAGIPFTSTAIYTYNGRTDPPFAFDEWLNGRIERRGRRTPYSPWIMAEDATRSEQALHGYNHQSLAVELWGERGPMVEALLAARERWETENLAPLPRTYVPPMNWIDSVGVSALREAFPEVETIAGLYFGPEELGQDREFGPEPWDPDLYALPRGTAGYLLRDSGRLRTLTLLHSVGVWSHFVHPDEVYPNADRAATYRENGLPDPTRIGWGGPDGMLAELQRWVRFVQQQYPWLDYVTAETAARRMRAFDTLTLAWDAEADGDGRRLDVTLSQPGQTLMTWARPGERLADAEGGTILDVWQGPLFTQYVVRAERRQLALRFAPAAPLPS